MDTYLAKTFDDTYRIVNRIRHFYFGSREMWFRGQGSGNYLLKPRLFRSQNGTDGEKDIFLEYKKLVKRIDKHSMNEWETLYNMHYYGVPTRLLDWTNNMGLALYYASTSSVRDQPMSLFILDPAALNQLSGIKRIPQMPTNMLGLSYLDHFVDKKLPPFSYPIAVKCEYVDEKTGEQNSMFTAHGEEEKDRDLDIITSVPDKESPVYKIVIAHEAQATLKKYFELSNIKDYTATSVIQGIVRYLCEKMY